MAEDNKIKTRTYIPKVYYNGELLPFKETPLTIKDKELCTYCKEEITIEQIEHIEPKIKKTTAKNIIKYLNKYRDNYKLDSCLRKAHFISQCLVESAKFKKLKESMAYGPPSLKKYYKESEFIKLTDSNIKKYVDKFKIIDIRKEAIKKKDKDKKDKYAGFEKLNPAYIYGNTKKKKYQVTIDLNKEKTISIKILSHSHNEKEVANRKYSDRNDIGNKGGDDGYNYLGRGIIQLTGKNNYNLFSKFRNKNIFPEDSTGQKDFTKAKNAKKIEDTSDPIYAVQSALWFWMEGNGKIYEYSDSDNVKNVTKRINGKTNHIKERNKYLIKSREDKGFKVLDHYKEVYKNGSKEDKTKVEENLKLISNDFMVYDSFHKKKVNLKDTKAEAILKELKKVKPIEIKPKGINTIPLNVTLDLKLKPIKP